jgi:hypothetical protein
MDLVRTPWIVFTTLRSAVLSCLGEQGTDCDVYQDLDLGVGLARRFRAGAAFLDLGMSPSLTWMHMELDGADEAQSGGGQIFALRIDASGRMLVPVTASTDLTVTVGAGLSPTLLVSPARPTPPVGATTGPPFPAFSGGVRIGFVTSVL